MGVEEEIKATLGYIKYSGTKSDIFKISTKEEFRSNMKEEIIYKSPSYLIKRYLNYPYYNYKLFF